MKLKSFNRKYAAESTANAPAVAGRVGNGANLKRSNVSKGGLKTRKSKKPHEKNTVYALREAILEKLLRRDMVHGHRQIDLLLEKCLERRPQDVMSLIGKLIPKEEATNEKGFTPIIVNAGEGSSVSIGDGKGQEGQASLPDGQRRPETSDSVLERLRLPSLENGRENGNGKA